MLYSTRLSKQYFRK